MGGGNAAKGRVMVGSVLPKVVTKRRVYVDDYGVIYRSMGRFELEFKDHRGRLTGDSIVCDTEKHAREQLNDFAVIAVRQSVAQKQVDAWRRSIRNRLRKKAKEKA